MLDIAPLLADTSIRNFQQGRVGYVVDAVEQALLLPEDMDDLRSMRKHEVFLSLKRDLSLVSSLLFFFIFILILVFSNLHIYFFERLSNLHIGSRR